MLSGRFLWTEFARSIADLNAIRLQRGSDVFFFYLPRYLAGSTKVSWLLFIIWS
jgi:hypothetical protein